MLGIGRKKELVMSDEHDNAKTMSPKTAEILDNIVRTNERVQELEHENAMLRARDIELIRELRFIKKQLEICETKRDMFQRHAVALFTRMVDLLPQMQNYVKMIDNALADAKEEALSPVYVVSPGPIDRGVQDIVEKINDERGTTASAVEGEEDAGSPPQDRVQDRRRGEIRTKPSLKRNPDDGD
jgi:hypothetical protein